MKFKLHSNFNLILIFLFLFSVINAQNSEKMFADESTRDFAQSLIKGSESPQQDYDLTLNCINMLGTGDIKDREFFYRTYKVIAKNIDERIIEDISSLMSEFFVDDPHYWLNKYNKCNQVEKRQFVNIIAFDLYLMSEEIESDSKQYFNNLESKIISKNHRDIIKEMKELCIKRAKDYKDERKEDED
jgi:hypothetical protein